MPVPLTVSCFSKIQIGFTFLVPAHPGSPWKRAVKWVCVCVSVKWLAVKTASEMTYIVSSGALNSTPTNQSRREFGIFARSVRVKLQLNCYAVAVPQKSVPPTPLYPPSSCIRIVLLDIKGGIRNVSWSSPPCVRTVSSWCLLLVRTTHLIM